MVVGYVVVERVIGHAFIEQLQKILGVEVAVRNGLQLQAATYRKVKFVGSPELAGARARVLDSGESQEVKLRIENLSYLVRVLPLRASSNEILGTISVALEIGSMQDAMAAFIGYFVVLGIILLTLGLLLAKRFADETIRPLGELAVFAATVGRGDFSTRTHIRREDELGVLADSLNAMATNLESNTASLDRLNAEIADRIEAERTILLERGRMKAILDSALDGIITVDKDQHIVLMNPAAEAIFRCRFDDVAGQPVEQFIPERFRDAHSHHVRSFDQTGVASRTMGVFGLVTGLRSDGEEFPIEASISQIEIEGSKLFSINCRDLTERVREAEAREQLLNQLQQSQKMEAFGQLAGGVAHDFNNLLTVITGYSELFLSKTGGDEDLRNTIGEIHKAGESAARLTRQLLTFSRQQIVEPRVLDCNEVIRDVEKMLRRLIGEDIQLVTVLDDSIPSLKIDPGQIEQVIMNLAINARDAMPEGGKLTIETREVYLDANYVASHTEIRAGQHVLIAVSDSGSGMKPEVSARVFEPFFTTKERGRGTGLGLAVVHGIVKQSKGGIEVYSEPGVGTTFKIYLPAVVDSVLGVAKAKIEVLPRGLESILLVEDEDTVRSVAKLVLESVGYRVHTASAGSEAIELMKGRSEPCELLITDVVMPEMSGRVLAEKLTAMYPSLKVLFISGYTDDAIIRHGVLQADAYFLQKPFSMRALAGKVREVLDA